MREFVHDVMISYRWRRYPAEARAVIRFLDELAVRSWIDVREIEQTRLISQTELENTLAEAANSSRLMLFFETDDAIEMDPSGTQSFTGFNWQVFEKQFTGEVLFVRPCTSFPSILYSCTGDCIWYYNIPYLAYLIALAVGRLDVIEDYWDKYFREFPATTAAAYHVWKFHALPKGVALPPIIDAARSDVRPNKVTEWFLHGRKDIRKNNRLVVSQGLDYSGWFGNNHV